MAESLENRGKLRELIDKFQFAGLFLRNGDIIAMRRLQIMPLYQLSE